MRHQSPINSSRWRFIASGLLILSVGFITAIRLSVPDPGRSRFSLTPERQQAGDRMVQKLKTSQTKPFDRPDEALDFYWSKRSPNGKPVDISELEQAAAEAEQLPLFSSARDQTLVNHMTSVPLGGATSAASAGSTLDAAWQPLGPGNIGGRSRALLIHRTKNNLMWTAGVAGGIWKSTDSGASWQPKGDLLVNIAVNSLIQDPILDNVLYAGTGEGFFNADAVRGQGIFSSSRKAGTTIRLPSIQKTRTPCGPQASI